MRQRADAIEHAEHHLVELFHAAGERRIRDAFRQLRARVHRRGERGRLTLRDGHVEAAQVVLDGHVAARRVGHGLGEELRRRQRGALQHVLLHVVDGGLHRAE